MVTWTDAEYTKGYEIEGLGKAEVKVKATVPEFKEVTDMATAITDISAVLAKTKITEGKGKNKKVMPDHAALIRCFVDGLEPKLRVAAFQGTNSDELDAIEEAANGMQKAGLLSLVLADQSELGKNFRAKCAAAGFDMSQYEKKEETPTA